MAKLFFRISRSKLLFCQTENNFSPFIIRLHVLSADLARPWRVQPRNESKAARYEWKVYAGNMNIGVISVPVLSPVCLCAAGSEGRLARSSQPSWPLEQDTLVTQHSSHCRSTRVKPQMWRAF